MIEENKERDEQSIFNVLLANNGHLINKMDPSVYLNFLNLFYQKICADNLSQNTTQILNLNRQILLNLITKPIQKEEELDNQVG